MRDCAASAARVSGFGALPLVLTRPVSSAAEAILVGCRVATLPPTEVIAGAAELPPDTLDCVPIRVSSEPYCLFVPAGPAAALAMPYIGLSGLLPVSFCDIAGMMTPLTPARVAAWARVLMPRRI